MSERWLPVVGYEGLYEVSDQGRVLSCARTVSRGGHPYRMKGRMLTPVPRNSHGDHSVVNLCRDGGFKTVYVHRLMLEAFVGPCPPGMEACHANDVTDDNRIENLRWDTPSSNRFDSVANGGHLNARKTHCPLDHEYTPENTYTNPNTGQRYCRACKARWNARYNNKNRAVI